MTTRRNLVRATLAVLAALLAAPAVGDTADGAGGPVLDSPPSLARFYTGSIGAVGSFPGTLVCLRCDLGSSPGAKQQCEATGHRHALSIDDGSMVHPLAAGTAEALRAINSDELHGKKVVVHGRHYPGTGVILVDRVDGAGEG